MLLNKQGKSRKYCHSDNNSETCMNQYPQASAQTVSLLQSHSPKLNEKMQFDYQFDTVIDDEDYDDIFPDYSPCRCDNGCYSRTFLIPCTLPLSCSSFICNMFCSFSSRKLSHVPLCMNDFLFVDRYCTCCEILSLPIAITKADMKAALQSRAMKQFDEFLLKDFKSQGNETMMQALLLAAQEFNGKETNIVNIIGNDCDIGDEECKSLCYLINSLPNVLSIELRNNLIHDNGLQMIMNSFVHRDIPRGLLLSTSVSNDRQADMLLVDLDGNTCLTVNSLIQLCKTLQHIKYPIFVSMAGIFTESNPCAMQSVKHMIEINPNVYILTNVEEYESLFREKKKKEIETRIPTELKDMSRSLF